jgi:arylsulfatase A-like enzyme
MRFTGSILATGLLLSAGALAKKPNIVFILTDDQDLHMQSMDYLPLIKKHITDKGTFYKRHYCTTALCCPSRVTLWTGKHAHNTNVTDVNPPWGKLKCPRPSTRCLCDLLKRHKRLTSKITRWVSQIRQPGSQ